MTPTSRLKHLEEILEKASVINWTRGELPVFMSESRWLLAVAKASIALSDKADIVLSRANGLDNKAGAIMGSALVDLDHAVQEFQKAMKEKA